LVWDGRRWKPDDQGVIIQRCKEAAARIYEEAAEIAFSEPEGAKKTSMWGKQSLQKARLEAMAWAAQSELPVHPDTLDSDLMLLNLDNGTLDLRNCMLREHRREDLLTKLAPVTLDGEAECPKWLEFLDKITDGDAELISFLQRAVGYSLTGLTDEQCFFLLHGTGANGKSTFLDVLMALMGDYARPTEFRTLLHRERSEAVRNDLAALDGLRFVTAVEVGRGKRLDEAVIKQLTGGDVITARFLFGEFFDFRPAFKIFIAANAKPEIHGQDEAIWRRVHLVPFEVYIPEAERDKRLPNKLKAELPGILNWAVEGLVAFRKQGLDPPEKVLAATKAYREEMDLLLDFLEDRCITAEQLKRPVKAIYEAVGALYKEYVPWCENEGQKAVTPKTFGQLLAERGFPGGREQVCGRRQRVRYGLQLKETEHEGNAADGEMLPF
jgi:putative DNA primase/helicase